MSAPTETPAANAVAPSCATDCPECAAGRIPDGQACSTSEYVREVWARFRDLLTG